MILLLLERIQPDPLRGRVFFSRLTFSLSRPVRNSVEFFPFLPSSGPVTALRYLGRVADGLLDRLFSVAGAILFSQIPRFMQQYIEFLSGALYEVRRQVDSIHIRASELGLSLESFISHHLNSSDGAFVASGKIMQEALERHRLYKEALEALRDSSLWSRPFLFLRYADWSLVRAMEFQPGLLFTVETLVYALLGMLAGYIFYVVLVRAPLTLVWGGRSGGGKGRGYEPSDLDV